MTPQSSVTRRLIFAVALGGGLPMAALVGLTYLSSTAQIAEVQARHEQVATRAADSITRRLVSLRAELETIAPAMHVLATRADRLALHAAHRNPDVTALFWTDAAGVEQFRWERINLVTRADFKNWSGTEMQRAIAAGRVYFSGVEVNEFREPKITIAVPFYDDRRILRGALGGELNLKAMWSLTFDVDVTGAGSVFVVNDAGTLIGHDNPSLVVGGFDASGIESIAPLLPSSAPPAMTSVRTRGLGGESVVSAARKVVQTGWWAVVETPLSSVLRPQRRMLGFVLFFARAEPCSHWSFHRLDYPPNRPPGAPTDRRYGHPCGQ